MVSLYLVAGRVVESKGEVEKVWGLEFDGFGVVGVGMERGMAIYGRVCGLGL
jgi:hypothetical protein